MQKYRLKPVQVVPPEIEATRITDWGMLYDLIPDQMCQPVSNRVRIITSKAEFFAEVGDYLVKNIDGEYYPVTADIFEATYEEVPSKERWEAAVENAKFMLEEYKKIPTGAFGAVGIANDIARYENGERTIELLEALEGIN